MSVIYEHFKTLENLVDTIEKRDYNIVFKNVEKASENPERAGTRNAWYGTKNYKEAKELLKKGYRDPLKQLKREILKVGKKQAAVKRPMNSLSVAGFAPHVPNAISGHPLSMITRKTTPQNMKAIRLLYGFSAIGNVSPSELIKGGTMFISLVNQLEKQGYRVKLDILRCTTVNPSDGIAYTCTLKEYSQPLNLLKLCFPLVHPSMLRRISFKWSETLPELTDRSYAGSYGATLYARLGFNSEREREWLKKHKILGGKDVYYCNVYEAMETNDISELAQKMGL